MATLQREFVVSAAAASVYKPARAMMSEQQPAKLDRDGSAGPGHALRLPQGCSIAQATAADLPAIAALLREADLPHEDIAPHLRHFLVARHETGKAIGAIGAEVHAPDALLRSLVVAPAYRGTGVGEKLIRELEDRAAAWGVERWWLLTLSAEKFFTARGFTPSAREQAPAAIQRARQFSGGCCSSAVCLTRRRTASA
jgi:amino-acid N-acetyltransferase